MPNGFPISGYSSGNGAEVNPDGEVLVAPTKTLGDAGMTALVSEVHDGASGLAKVQRRIMSSYEGRLAVGQDNILWDDAFIGANMNLSKYQVSVATMTVAQTGGMITLNNGGSVATTVGCQVKTWRTFPTFGNYSTTIDFTFSLALVPQANNIIEIGIGTPAATNPFAPTDGVYMQIDTAGALQLVANFNGTPTTSGAISFSWTANRMYHAELVLHRDRAALWIDDVLYGQVLRSTTPSSGAMSINQSEHLFARLVNSAGTTGAQKLNISNWAVALNDVNASRLWATAMGGMGQNGINLPDGVTAGMSANISNSAAPASATLSNTAAGYTTKGGNWQYAAVAGAETDYALFGYQVPAPSVTQPGKTLLIRGVRIEAWVMGAAVATTPTLLNWYLGVGSTAVSLATADSSGAATGTRAPRRIPLGIQSLSVGAVIGAAAVPVDVNFDSPLSVEAGTYMHIILRIPVATATASQIIRGMVTLNDYWE